MRFIDKRIADFEKEMLTASTDEMRKEYVKKIEELRRKRIDDNIDIMRHEKADFEQRLIHGRHEPSYKDLIIHAQDKTTLEIRIKNRERALEITAQSPLSLEAGGGNDGGSLQVLRVKDVKLFDDEEVAAAQQSEQYKLMKKTIDEITKHRKAPPSKRFQGSAAEFNKVGDASLSEIVAPQAKLSAYEKG